MIAIVNKELNQRELQPSVNATLSKYHREGQSLEVVDAVLGDPYDDDDLWYRLKDGSYVWSGGVDLVPDLAELPEIHRNQYLISYRNIYSDGRINLDDKIHANGLYFRPVPITAFEDRIKVNTLLAKPFANSVAKAANEIGDGRKNVIVYIHGHQPIRSTGMELLSHFTQNYFRHPIKKVAKVLLMTWPADGLSRKRLDDRALRAGNQFTLLKMFEGFAELSIELGKVGMHLNLVTHSFAHQLLNGMLNAGPAFPKGIFDNIFLMAPDVTHHVVNKNGFELTNYFPDRGQSNTNRYDYSQLKDLGNNVHIFWDEQDYLLYASTKKFVAKHLRINANITQHYRNLGNYGDALVVPQGDLIPGLNFYPVGDLVAKGEPGNLLDYPFCDMPGRTQEIIRDVRQANDYGRVKDLDILFHRRRYTDHHRYVFTCRPVVTKVLELLRN